ncbi:unnamed protein product [Phytophthora lilii]|uniref:Unnamed protein product n=1 Tax=Phytophthora lilii TaxID=2077276 RepID=A0A9W6X2I0_9STRA|nr:unnamed protein product [Phytophthora lilii]
MTNEDALSIIDALSTKREELEQKGKFNTTSLQEVLSTKQDEAQVVQTKLDEKQYLTWCLLTAANVLVSIQLSASLGDISDQIATAKDTAEELEREIASLAKDIEEQEARREDLHASVAKAKKTNDDIQAKCQEHQRKSQSMTKSQAKLRHHKDSLLKQEKQLALELREVENLSRVLGEGIKVSTLFTMFNPLDI